MADNKPDIGFSIGLDGEKEYKSAISGINKDLAVLNSEGKKLTAQYKNNASSIEALTAKSKLYNSQIAEQKKKIDTMRAALENASATWGENSNRAKDWQIKINRAEAELAEMERTLSATTAELKQFGKSASVSAEELDDAKNKIKDFSSKAAAGARAAAGAVTALIAGLTGLGTAAVAVTKSGAEYADNILTTAKNTGLATDYLEAYAYAAELVDVDLETMTKSMAKNIKSMSNAQKGTADYVATYKQLGVSVTTSNGKLRDAETVYWEVIDSLGRISDETERDALSMQIFGKSAQELNSLISVGSAGMAQYAAEAEAAGAVLGGKALESLGELDDTFQRVNSSTAAWKNQLAAKLAPNMNRLTLQALQLAQKSMPKLELQINKITRKLGKFDIEDFADGIEKVGKGAKIAAPLVGSFVAVFAGYKTYQAAASGITAVTAAAKALKVAMTGHPVLLAVTAGAALVGVMGSLAAALEVVERQESYLTDEQRLMIETARDAATAYGDLKEAAAEQATAELSQVSYVQKLYGELQTLADENGRVKKGYESRASFILNELNSALDTEYTMNGNIIGQYDQMAESIDNIIKAKKAQILLDAHEESYRAAVENVTEAEKAQTAQEIAVAEAMDNAVEAEKEYQRILEQAPQYQWRYLAERNKAVKAYEEEQKTLDELNSTVALYYADIFRYETASTAILEGETDKAISALDGMGQAFVTASEIADMEISEQLDTLEYQVIETERKARRLAEAYKNGQEGVTEQMVQDARDKAELAKHEFYIAGGDIVKSTAEGADGSQYIFNNEMRKIINDASWAATSHASSFENAGSASIQGMIRGMVSKRLELRATARELAEEAAASVRAALDIHSPSRVMEKLGSFTAEGYVVGMNKKLPAVESAASRVAAVAAVTSAPSITNTTNNRSSAITMNNTFHNASRADAQTLVNELNRLLGDLL